MIRYGLIGYPLGHSFSAKYFTEKFKLLGLHHHVYHLFPLQHIAELPQLLAQHPDLRGLNVTIPYKKDVISYLDESFLPPGLAACNCITIHNGKLTGYNTDVIGFKESLKPILQSWHTNALVLGNGGAALAVKFALTQLRIPFTVVGRSAATGIDMLYSEVTEHVIATTPLIINTTPVGTWPNIDEKPILPYRALTPRHLLYDLIYNPEITAFMQMGVAAQAVVKNGWDMLVHQAEANWRIWNGAEG